jgi:hypothetical protein
MTNKYGPWIAFNPGDTPPSGDVMVQVQLACQTRIQAEEGYFGKADYLGWLDALIEEYQIIAYRILQQPVRGDVVMLGNAICLDKYHNSLNTHRVTFPTDDGQLIPGTYTGPDGAQIKIEALK